MLRYVKAEHVILLSSVFFAGIAIVLHYHYLFWDFCAYKLSGEYLLGISHRYFELFRPPAMPVLLASLGSVGYFVIAEVLLAIGALMFSRRFSINAVVFYFLVQAPAAAVFSVTAGSEVLAIAMGLLALAFYDSPVAGLFLGLAFLTRYSMVLYALPLLYLAWRQYRSHPRLLLSQAFIFLLVTTPWLAYNYVHFGNPFASMLDFTFLNGPAREYLWHWPNLSFLSVLLPTILLAVPTSRRQLAWWGFAAVIFVVYLATPFRAVRYLIPALPFLAVPAAENVQRSRARKYLTVFVVLSSLLGAAAVAYQTRGLNPRPFVSAAYALGGCTAVSNAWVPLACVGAYSRPLVVSSDLRNHALVVFPGYPMPVWYSGDPFAVAAYPGMDYNLFVPAHCVSGEGYVGTYLKTYNHMKGRHFTYWDVILCILHLRRC